MTEYLTRDDVLTAASFALGHPAEIGDWGLLDAAVARPQATVFGQDAYESLFDKAAALFQSLTRNHALIDGNKRCAWASAWTFLDINGVELVPQFDVDVAEEFVNAVAEQGELTIAWIAERLMTFARS